MRKKKKQKKLLHPPGGELLSAMQVPSDLAFGEPVVTFYGGREVQIENYRRILEYNACRLTAGFWNIMRAASACLHNTAGCSLWERKSGLFRIPGRRCGWKGESIR